MLYGTDITGCGERQMAVRQCVCPAVTLLGDRGGTKEEEKAKQEGQSIPQKGPTDMFKGQVPLFLEAPQVDPWQVLGYSKLESGPG